MGFFDLFRKRRKIQIRKRQNKGSHLVTKRMIEKTGVDIQGIQNQMGIINIALKKHDDELSQHIKILDEHTKRIETLEQLIVKPPVQPPIIDLPTANRPDETIHLPIQPQKQSPLQCQKFNISRFSEQEKRILALFFENKDMALSYADIGRYLGKSPNTIKNQLRQINIKADLFDYTIGNESRKRFKLKDGLRIEKYLNINRPSDQPAVKERLS